MFQQIQWSFEVYLKYLGLQRGKYLTDSVLKLLISVT